ncbi:MAG: hypothetical protein WCS99_13310 [Limisphaerales bacterium]
MSEEATDKLGKTWLYVVSMLVGLPLLYVLSVGPAAVLVHLKPSLGQSVLLRIYNPLDSFANATGTHEALGAYIDAWIKLTGTPP